MSYWIQIASLPDQEAIVAEIYVEEAQFAEVRHEAGTLRVEIYPLQAESRGTYRSTI